MKLNMNTQSQLYLKKDNEQRAVHHLALHVQIEHHMQVPYTVLYGLLDREKANTIGGHTEVASCTQLLRM